MSQGQGNGTANAREDFEVVQALNYHAVGGRSKVSFIPCIFLLSILFSRVEVFLYYMELH